MTFFLLFLLHQVVYNDGWLALGARFGGNIRLSQVKLADFKLLATLLWDMKIIINASRSRSPFPCHFHECYVNVPKFFICFFLASSSAASSTQILLPHQLLQHTPPPPAPAAVADARAVVVSNKM